ncbi:MAG: CHAT domain-containing protein [Sphingomonas fennica]
MSRRLILLAFALAGGAAAKPPPPLPDAFTLGRDATGEPCTAARSWRDGRLASPFDRAWTISCRGVSAARAQGSVVRLRDAGAAPDAAACGVPALRPLAGIGPVEARRCADPQTGQSLVTLRFRRSGQTYVGTAVESAAGPLDAAVRAAAEVAPPPADRDVTIAPAIPPATLAAPPATSAEAAVTGRREAFDPAGALQTGIALNHRGLYVEASRLLNDALSRLAGDTDALTRAEFELEAGLADSNISQFDAADDHFARAAPLLAAGAGQDRSSALEAKRVTYRGLDQLNRRQWAEAVRTLAEDVTAGNPLRDPTMLSRLNQAPSGAGASAALSSVSGAQFARLLLEAQRNWARSVALLAIGSAGPSRRALDDAAASVAILQRSVDPDAIVALKSRIQRQYGRIAAREGKIDLAVAAFDCALGTLQGQPPSAEKPCPMDMPAGRRFGSAGTAEGPMIAETELERAAILSRRPGVDPAEVIADYDQGVDALIAANAAGGIVPTSLESYLDLLAETHAKAPSEAVAEKFFRAIQAVGEPAIARQLSQLQAVVAADSGVGAKVRDRAEVERRIVRLRYAIAAANPADGAAIDAIDRDRRAAEAELATLNAAIGADSRFRAVDDRPATIAQLRAALRPQEIYLKVSRLRGRSYATVISPERSWIYPLAASADDVDGIALRVRASIRDESGRLPYFDVAAAFTLFKLVAGPAEAALLKAKALVFDPAGAMQNLPAGVLVVDLDSVRRYRAARETAPNDYSRVAFLAGRAEIATALSPRSFLIARALPESTAPHPFIGFGENAPPEELSGAAADRMISFGTGCPIRYGALATMMSANRPVSAREIGVAAAALGDPSAPEITGRAFTDTGVMAASERGDYAGYQVIHFATHGLPEMRAECTIIPPSLVTTLAPPGAADAPASDGLLTFSEIAQMRLNANLVVLSACETAAGVSGLSGRRAGQDESSATLDGLVRAFITANARAVLATYWKVPDTTETERLIRLFYEAGRTRTIGDALEVAQADAIARPATSHPYFWGAFFLVGDAGKTMLSRPAPQTAAR